MMQARRRLNWLAEMAFSGAVRAAVISFAVRSIISDAERTRRSRDQSPSIRSAQLDGAIARTVALRTQPQNDSSCEQR